MFNKALWLKNYKQSKFVVWGLWVVCLYFAYKLYTFIDIQERSMQLHTNEWGSIENYSFHFHNFLEVGVFQMIVIVLLASILIGLERTNQSLDFTLSLPYKRQEIFFNKWLFGVTHIFSALTVSVFISGFILVNSKVHDYLPLSALGIYFVIALFSLIGIYSFSLLMGFIGASIVSQFAFSILFLFLPNGLYHLVIHAVGYHYYAITGTPFYKLFDLYNVDVIFDFLSFPIMLFDVDNFINDVFVWKQSSPTLVLLFLIVPAVVTGLSLFFMKVLANRIKSENNGKILAYEKLLPYLKVGVFICFYLFGGMVFGSFNYYDELPSLLSYHLGGLGFSLIAYFILIKLAGMRMVFGRK
ncbi:hypothetical protein V7138_09460 [Bacillus sp. JJ1533]|uniref:hypothetical protein n=1 Tax=Bacillus sp. JJ1533 TaxID=3122959 RepID=UPI002FFEA8B2